MFCFVNVLLSILSVFAQHLQCFYSVLLIVFTEPPQCFTFFSAFFMPKPLKSILPSPKSTHFPSQCCNTLRLLICHWSNFIFKLNCKQFSKLSSKNHNLYGWLLQQKRKSQESFWSKEIVCNLCRLQHFAQCSIISSRRDVFLPPNCQAHFCSDDFSSSFADRRTARAKRKVGTSQKSW